MDDDEIFDVVTIDADSLIYKIAYVYPSMALGKKALDADIQKIIANVEAANVIIYIKGPDNFRFLCDPEYKGNRNGEIDKEVKNRIDQLYEYAQEWAFTADGGEADDYCTILMYEAMKQGQSCIVSHIDKDLDCIPGWHHNFRTGEITYIEPEDAYKFLIQQLITGDGTDNIKGCYNIGPKRAQARMRDIPVERLLQLVLDTWQEIMGDNWQELFVKCANCIYLRTDPKDMRPLTFEELKDRLTWTTEQQSETTLDTGSSLKIDHVKPLGSSTPSLAQPEDNTSEESN